MKKLTNYFLLNIILLSILFTPVSNGIFIYNYKANSEEKTSNEELEVRPTETNKTVHVEDIHELDWTLLNVGDTLDIDVQDLNNFNDYVYMQEEWNDIATYSPDNNSYTLVADSRDIQPSVQPKYIVATDEEIYFGTTFNATSTRGFFGLHGYIQMITRPTYNYTHSESSWSNSGSGENSWYASVDPDFLEGVKLKYKEEGRFKTVKYSYFNFDWNTQTVHIDPENAYGEFMICTLPEGNTTYNCNHKDATNVSSIGYSINPKYLTNQYISMRFNAGTYIDESELEVFGMNTHAYVESFGEITTSNKQVYVGAGTTLEQAHDKADPRYNEFVENVVTAVDREIKYEDLIDDGGYDPNTVGVYTLAYNVDKGFEGGFVDTEYVDIHVINPDQVTSLEAYDVTYPLTYAPRSEAELMERMMVSAYDPNFGEDVSDQVKISNLGGYNPSNPRVGQYTITYYINASNGTTVYEDASLRIISPALSEEVSLTQNIIEDEDGDLLVSPGETVTFEVILENTSGVDLRKPSVTYSLDSNYLLADTFELIDGEVKIENIGDSQLDVQYDHIFKDEIISFQYRVEASTGWNVHTAAQDLTNLINIFKIEIYDTSYEKILPAGLFEEVFTSFDSTFTAEDADGDNVISPGEEIVTTDVFANNSYYSLSDISVYIGDGDKIDSTPVSTVVKSNLRDLSSEDYLVNSNDVVYVYDVMPNETITIEQKFKANETFNTADNVELDSVHRVYGQSVSEIAHEQVLTAYFDIDKSEVYNVNIETTIADYNNGQVTPGERFEIEFVIENNGYVILNDLVLSFDLSDINIETSELSMDIVELNLFDTDGTEVAGKSVIGGNEIHFAQIKPNQKLVGRIMLKTRSQFDTDEFIKTLLEAKVSVPVEVIEGEEEIYTNILSLPLDTASTANLKTTAKVIEQVGDGDGKVDPNESFEYIFNLQNNGKIDLNMLAIALSINANKGVAVESYAIEVYDNGEESEDYILEDDILTINHLDPGHELVINIIVNYGSRLYDNITNNVFTINQAYLSDEVRQFNIPVDIQNNQTIELVAKASETVVAPGQVINVDLTSTNTGSTTEYNSILNIKSEDQNATTNNLSSIVINDGEYEVGVDYEVTKQGIVIYEQQAGEEIAINFDLMISHPLYIDPTEENYTFTVDFAQTLGNKKVITDSIDFTPNVKDTAITTSLEVETLTGENYPKTSDGLKYTYTIENGSDINLTNTTVNIDTSDFDLSHVQSFVVSSTDETFEYSADPSTNTVTFRNLAAGENVTIIANATTNVTFDSSSTVDATFNLNSDFIEYSNSVAIEKDLEFTTNVETSSTLLTTSSGNLLLGADEIVTYQVRIANVGTSNISDLVVNTNIGSQANFTGQSISSVEIDGVEIVETEGYKYDASNTKLTVDELKAGEVLVVVFDIQTSDSIEYEESIPVINTITSNHVNEIEQINLYIDTSHIGNLEIEHYIDETYSDKDGKVDPGEINYIDLTLINTDFIGLEDVYIYDQMDEQNLMDHFLEVEIYDDNDKLLEEDVDYIHYGDYVHIPSIPGNSSIRARIKLEATETFNADNNVTIRSMVRATFPTVGVVDTPFELTVPLDKTNNLDYDLNLDIANANGNEFISPGDTIDIKVKMTNTGKVDIKDAYVIFAINDNVDLTTAKLDLSSSLNASISGMYWIVNQLKVGETITLTGTVKTKETFDSSEKIQFDASANHQTVAKHVTDSIRVDTSSSELKASYELIETSGDGDGLIDPSEKYDLIFTLENTGDIELAYIELFNTELSPNIKSMDYDGTLSLVEGNDITVKSMKAGEKQVITFHIEFANIFNEDTVANINYNISQLNIDDIAVEVEPEIDTYNSTNIQTELTVSDASGNDLASNNEELMYTYTVKNTGLRNISNLVIKADLSDKNLSDTPYDQVVTIDGVITELKYNDTTKSYLIPQLKVGQELVLEYKVSTRDILTYPIVGKLFNKLIPHIVSITSLDNTVDKSNLVRIPIDPEVLKLSASGTIVDENKNGYLSANENFVYELKLENKGGTHLDYISTRGSQTGVNVVTRNNISVIDENDNPLVLDEDYTIVDNMVTITHMDAGDIVTIRYELTASSQIYMSGSTNIRSVVSNQYIPSQTLNTSILPDSEERTINYSFNSVLSEELTYNDFGKSSPSTLVINNTGNTIETDFKVSVDKISSQMAVNPESIEVFRNGIEVTPIDYDPKVGTVTIPELHPNETVVISADTTFNETIIAEENTNDISFDYDVRVDYSEGSYQILETSNTITKTLISKLSTTASLTDSLTDTDSFADAGEMLTGSIEIYNEGYLQETDLEVTVKPNDINAVEDSLEFISVTNSLDEELSTTTYTIENNTITLDDVASKQMITIEYQYQVKDYLDLGEDLEIKDLVLSDIVNITTDVGNELTTHPEISVNPSVSSISVDGLLSDASNNGMVHPTENLDVMFKFTNDGTLVQYNIPFSIESSSSNIKPEDIMSISVVVKDDEGNERILENGVDYTIDSDKNILYLMKFNPGEIVEIAYDYTTPEIIQNVKSLVVSMSATPELKNKVRKSLSIPVDYENSKHLTATSTLVRDETVGGNEQEQITYSIDLVNDGQVEYMQLFTTIYLTESYYDGLDNLVFTVTKNGDEYEPFNVERYDDVIKFELYDINVGDEFHVEIRYTIDNPKATSISTISTMLYATGYTKVLNNMVRLGADPVTPEIERQDPYIYGLESVTIVEETMISDETLNTLFEIETNEGAGRVLTIDYDIDPNVPGEYPVTYTLEDTLTDAEPAVFKPTLIVEDKVPVITGLDKVTIDRSETIDDLITAFQISATEIRNGDLTYAVTIEEEIKYGVIGSYPIVFAVADNEGNSTKFNATVEIVNGLYPVLTGEDAILTVDQANDIMSEEQLLTTVNAFAQNYDGTNLTSSIELSTDNGFMANSGNYVEGDSFVIEYQVTNDQKRMVTEQSVITINDNINSLSISSQTPIIVKIDDHATLEDITDIANPIAHVTENGSTSDVPLTIANIIETNYIQNTTGLYMVKYQYQTNNLDINLSATHNVLVFANEDGVMPDNSDITITDQVTTKVNPGDRIEYTINIVNNSLRTKTISEIVATVSSENVGQVESMSVALSNGESAQYSLTKARNANNNLYINNLQIPSAETATLNVILSTNQLFSYEEVIDTDISYHFDGETRTSQLQTEVAQDAIQLVADTKFDKDVYYEGDMGTVTTTITNSGTMDSQQLLLDLVAELTNIEIISIYLNGDIVNSQKLVSIKAKQSIEIVINFKVNDTVMYGTDIINIIDDFNHSIEIVIPVDYTVVPLEDTQDTSTTSNKENNLGDKTEISLTQTGSNSMLVILMITLISLVRLRVKN